MKAPRAGYVAAPLNRIRRLESVGSARSTNRHVGRVEYRLLFLPRLRPQTAQNKWRRCRTFSRNGCRACHPTPATRLRSRVRAPLPGLQDRSAAPPIIRPKLRHPPAPRQSAPARNMLHFGRERHPASPATIRNWPIPERSPATPAPRPAFLRCRPQSMFCRAGTSAPRESAKITSKSNIRFPMAIPV